MPKRTGQMGGGNKMKLIIQNKAGSRFINGIEAHHIPNAEELVNDALKPKNAALGLKMRNNAILREVSHG